MRTRVNKPMRSRHAVRKAGYTLDDIVNVTHFSLPQGVSSVTARRIEQTVMEGWKSEGVSLVNIKDPEIQVPFGGYLP